MREKVNIGRIDTSREREFLEKYNLIGKQEHTKDVRRRNTKMIKSEYDRGWFEEICMWQLDT